MTNFRIKILVAAIVACLPLFSQAQAQEPLDLSVLPAVSAVPAEPTPHFPSRLAAFVWRNWNLTELERMTETVGAEPEQLKEIAQALGLPEYQAPSWDPGRFYITIVRRNWSLLPYDQLLTLLRFEPKEFAEKLREDDFLSVKLGAKPFCEPLLYAKPTEEEFAQMRKIAQDVRDVLGSDLELPEVERFAFLEEFAGESTPAADENAPNKAPSQFEICYLHSYFAVFGDPLLQDSSLLYPDKLLEKLQARGVNGVWLHSLLRDLTPPTEDFPEFGDKSEIRRANLRNLVDRAKKYGIDVYLYMNEPRAMPVAFFENHPEEKGVVEGTYAAMCFSAPKVKKWLIESLEFLFRETPGLGGVFTISGSENLTTCVSHGKFKDCPRCSQFSDVDLIVDLNAAVEEGVHRAAPDAKVIVWDWGWRGHAIATDIVEKLPKNVWLQSVSEWSIPINRGGVPAVVGEYSISVVGPGPRATAHWAAAKEAGLKTIAKCQFNSTWEIASVPSIPALELVARHAHNLSRAGVDGVMAGWSLGGYPTINLEIVNAFATNPNATIDGVLDELAQEYYGEGASLAREAWKNISDSFEEFPYSGVVMYCAPTQIGPANLLREKRANMPATMVGIPYDDLYSWRIPYPEDVFASQMLKCGQGFLVGSEKLKEATKFSPDAKRVEAQNLARYAEVIGVNYLSVANQTNFIVLRDERNALLQDLAQNGADPDKEARVQALAKEMTKYAQSEIELAKRLRRATLEDSCIGFESTNQYWFVPVDLVEKVVSCLDIIENLGAK